jgi:mono/diheme cytochrome c family protein
MRASIRIFALTAALVFVAGCRQDMQDQPKYIPLRPSAFFADGRSQRPPIEGTVPRNWLREDAYLYTGKANGVDGTEFPFAITPQDMDRGRQRFNIYCTPCHSQSGDGNGMIVQRGFKVPPTYHQDRLRNAPVGYLYGVITNGFGVMPDYSSQITAEDRWRVVAYIRALQLSQNAKLADVPAGAQVKKGEKKSMPVTGTPIPVTEEKTGETPATAVPAER